MPLTADQLQRLEILERVASCFSLAGTIFIFVTFASSSKFRRPINRLVFYASWGNILGNIATLISESGIRAGHASPLCQFQAFLIQMFVPADAFWNLAMALNVYLTLFKKYNAQQLKAQEWKYHLGCYGAPFIIALACVFAQSHARGKIYGPAVLWCWISAEWDFLRIALCYGPAWICILISFGIYLSAGREIFKKRQQLRAFNSTTNRDGTNADNSHGLGMNQDGTYDVEAGDAKNWANSKTTHIAVTTELGDGIPMTVTTDEFEPVRFDEHLSVPKRDRERDRAGQRRPRPTPKQGAVGQGGSKYEQYTVSIASSNPLKTNGSRPSMPDTLLTAQARRNRAAMEANKAAWGYTKVAVLFFISLLVTWVPSSANRVWALAHPGHSNVGLAYVAGLVLSLMGFWNSVIYIFTSRAACREVSSSIYTNFRDMFRGKSNIMRTMNMKKSSSRPTISSPMGITQLTQQRPSMLQRASFRAKSGQRVSWGDDQDDFVKLSDADAEKNVSSSEQSSPVRR